MKILHVINDLAIGGSQQVVATLANCQVAAGHEVGIAAAHGDLSGSLDERIIRYDMPADRNLRVSGAWAIRCALRDQPWSIVHTHQRRNATLVNMLSGPGNAAHVEHVHNTFSPGLFKALSFRSDALIACGSGVGRMLVQDFHRPVGKVYIVMNGVPDHGVRRNSPSDNPSKLRLLNIARASQQKDPFKFVRVVAELIGLGVDAEALWVGGGELSPRARELTAQLRLTDHVVFLDSDPAAVSHLSSADVLFMTSRWEGLPLVSLEACAAGVPIVAPDVGSLSDVVAPGVNGLLYSTSADDADIAVALASLGEDRRRLEDMAISARSTYESRFTLDRFRDEIFGVYEEATSRRS